MCFARRTSTSKPGWIYHGVPWMGDAIIDHELDDGSTERGVMYFSQVEKDVVVAQRLPGGARGEVTVPAGQLIFAPF